MSGMFEGMNRNLVDALNTVLQGQTSVYGGMINTISVSSFTLFIIYRGYQTLGGKLNQPIDDIIWDIARAAVILTFVLNLGGWLDMSISAINGLKDGISGSDNVWNLLDTVWEKTQKLGQSLYDKDDSTYVKLNGGFAQLLVWAGAIVTLLTGAFVNILAAITILLMTTTAPLFIFCLMYGFLTPMFNNWLQTIFTAILTVMFSALSIRLSISYLNRVIEALTNVATESNIVTVAAQTLLAGLASGAVIWFSSQLARALGGVAVQAVMQGSASNASKSAGNLAIKSGAGAGQLASKGIPKLRNALDSATTKGMNAYDSRRLSRNMNSMDFGQTNQMWSRRQSSINNMIKNKSENQISYKE